MGCEQDLAKAPIRRRRRCREIEQVGRSIGEPNSRVEALNASRAARVRTAPRRPICVAYEVKSNAGSHANPESVLQVVLPVRLPATGHARPAHP